ncbi:MAG: glycosyltransferase family 2 protein [Patescibacteria group bacterium]|nr:glycosyltransferase family 2 protein [Patescibacteria group bacterium]
MKLVSVIIVSWNGLHWLKKSLPSLHRVTYKPLEVILVDNSSTDGTQDWVTKHFPYVKIISITENLGYAEANNKGFEASHGEYVLFLNNDVEVTPTFITKLVKAIENNDDIAGAQSKILLLDDKDRYDTIGAFLTSTGFLYHYCFMNKQNKKYDKQIDIFTPKGACMIFKRSYLQNILLFGKLFDPDAFAYFEETDMAHRIWLSGKRIIYVPESVIYHKMGGTSTKIDNAFIQYHSFKNRIASYIKNLEISSLCFIFPTHLFCCELYALFYLFLGKFNIFVSIQKAILWNAFHVKKTMKKRAYIQKHIREIFDKEYFLKVFRNPPLDFYISQIRGNAFYE